MRNDSDTFRQPPALDGQTQLLLDEAGIEDRYNLERVLHRPIKYERNPILLRDKPWEGSAAYRPQVIYDPHMARYRMWYQCADMNAYHGAEGSPYYVGYAESDDGLNWIKPTLKGRSHGPYADTNIVYHGHMADAKGQTRIQIGQVWLDDHAPENERYKMVGLDSRPHPRMKDLVLSGVSIVGSPDGFNWTLLGDEPIFDQHSDTSNHLVHDPARNRWLLYCRPSIYASGRTGVDSRHHRRRVSVMVSDDLKSWSYPRTILFGDERDLVDIDHCHVFRYGSHFLMLYAAIDGEDLGRFHTRLASSTDGIHWQRYYTREDFVPTGEPGSWDAGIIGPSSGPVPQGDQLLFYYLGANVGQGEPFAARTDRRMGGGACFVPRDRFVSQRASGCTGYLLTREFVVDGSTLVINAQTDGRPASKGRIRVEVLKHPPLGYHADAYIAREDYTYACEGFSLDDCRPFAGDRYDAPVTWATADLASLKGQSVYLRFEITNADLFAYRIEP